MSVNRWIAGWVVVGAVGIAAAALYPHPSAGLYGGGWSLLHVLEATGGDCGASAPVADYLARRGPLAEVTEKVLIVGRQPWWESRLRQARFTVETIDEERLANRYGVDNAPMLVALRPDGRVAYLGGYSQNRPEPRQEFRDLAILNQLRSGERTESLPVVACRKSAIARVPAAR